MIYEKSTSYDHSEEIDKPQPNWKRRCAIAVIILLAVWIAEIVVKNQTVFN